MGVALLVGVRYYGFGVVGLLVCRCTMVLV